MEDIEIELAALSILLKKIRVSEVTRVCIAVTSYKCIDRGILSRLFGSRAVKNAVKLGAIKCMSNGVCVDARCCSFILADRKLLANIYYAAGQPLHSISKILGISIVQAYKYTHIMRKHGELAQIILDIPARVVRKCEVLRRMGDLKS